MPWEGIIYVGPPTDDRELLESLPAPVRGLLEDTNGLVAFDGGLHIRGACRAPAWHSLRHVWLGDAAFHARYPDVRPDDIPFAQDAVGDQWLLRDDDVIRLAAETGQVEQLGQTFEEFLAAVDQAPVDTLGLHPLMRFQRDGGALAPGQLLNVYPPFCVAESRDGASLRAIPALQRIDFLAWLATQIPGDGEQVRFEIKPEGD